MKQYVTANKTKSDIKSINYGVPQGSVLGPLLFLLYTNDIFKCTDVTCKIRLFADDTNIFISDNSTIKLKDNIQHIVSDINKWCNANKLTINTNKTCYTIFKADKTSVPL
jgi:hypothetical protein